MALHNNAKRGLKRVMNVDPAMNILAFKSQVSSDSGDEISSAVCVQQH
jgi:hypothetical protein